MQQMTTIDFFTKYLMKIYIVYGKAERIPSWASYREEPYYRAETTSFMANGDIKNATYDIWNLNNRASTTDFVMKKVRSMASLLVVLLGRALTTVRPKGALHSSVKTSAWCLH